MVRMSALLFAVASQVDGRTPLEPLARRVAERLGRPVGSGDVAYLVDHKLRPAGVVAPADGAPVALRRSDPLLGLRFRARVVPAEWVWRATGLAWPLFFTPVVVAVLAALILFDGWLFFVHGLAQGVRQVLLVPELTLLVLGLLIAATAFHELGHAAACRFGGARPGPIGVGLYLAWPVFYSDVTDSYRLDRDGRLRTDLGGVYFNLVFALAVGGVYLLTHFEPLLLVIALVHIEVLHQFFPFFRLDGYYVASDLIGVPDLFQRIRPTLASLLPGRPLPAEVAALKPWARAAVAAWVFVTLATMAALYVLLVSGLPRLLGTARASLLAHGTVIAAAVHQGRPAVAATGLLELAFMLLPLAALLLTAMRAVRFLAVAGWRVGDAHPMLRFASGLAAGVAVGFAVGALWSTAHYRPIQPWERGVLPAVAAPLPTAPSLPAVEGTRAPYWPASTPSAAGSPPAPAPAATAAPTTATPQPSLTPAPSAAPSPGPSSTPVPSPSPS
jgi:putative peptide zinc metalloprotease protein